MLEYSKRIEGCALPTRFCNSTSSLVCEQWGVCIRQGQSYPEPKYVMGCGQCGGVRRVCGQPKSTETLGPAAVADLLLLRQQQISLARSFFQTGLRDPSSTNRAASEGHGTSLLSKHLPCFAQTYRPWSLPSLRAGATRHETTTSSSRMPLRATCRSPRTRDSPLMKYWPSYQTACDVQTSYTALLPMEPPRALYGPS